MDLAFEIIKQLSDGKFHSGEVLATRFGVSRAAVWKHLKRIRNEIGLEVHAVQGRGYRLARRLELLQEEKIRSFISESGSARISTLEIHEKIDSTNSYLMSKAFSGAESGAVCLAEQQTSGRGRRGRQWVSPFGTNVYLSLYWSFPLSPAALTGLSIAAGITVAETLEQMGIQGIALKWPNDVLWNSRKLAGLLLEVSGEHGGPSRVVLGLGINTLFPPGQAESIDQPWIDLSEIPGGGAIGRNALAGALIDNLAKQLVVFEQEGMTPFIDRWERYDVFTGKPVVLQMGSEMIHGVHRGIDARGALLLERNDRIDAFHGGEVSLRPRR